MAAPRPVARQPRPSEATKGARRPRVLSHFIELAADAREVVKAHVHTLVDQLARIVADGVAAEEFVVDDPRVAARAAFDATSRFHNPVHAAEWADPQIDCSY